MNELESIANPDYRLVIGKSRNDTGFQLKDVRLHEEAEMQIEEVLDGCRDLKAIETDQDEQLFIEALSQLTDIRGHLKSSHDYVKRPFLDACQLIDDKTREFRGPVDQEYNRLQGELARHEGAKRREQLAEQQRQAELALKARLAAIREPDANKAEQLNQEAGRAVVAAATALKRIEGVSVKIGWEPELIDPKLVMATYPYLLEITLRKSAVQSLLKGMRDVTEDTIPGIKLTPKTKVLTKR